MTTASELHGLILAAGGSRRMGRPKALLPTHEVLKEATLIEAHIAAMAPVCRSIRVVLGHAAMIIREKIPATVEVVENTDWARTHMADSIRLGLDGFEEDTRVLMTPVDVPPAPIGVLKRLVAENGTVVPRYGGRDGHPVVFEAGRALRSLTTGTLARALEDAARMDVDWPDCLTNLNTPECWMAWLDRLNAGR